MTNITIKEEGSKIEREIKLHSMSNDLNFELIKGSKEVILFIIETIINRINIKIDLSLIDLLKIEQESIIVNCYL